ncbi:hypothetical protein QZH41_003623 [Actinostola sp. cb2023]|nr:hypothetical protein QZH41_003623 [Actinostola sp. cb2023]
MQWLLSSMISEMSIEMTFAAKLLITVRTFKWLLSSMNSEMISEMDILAKLFIAVKTMEWLLSSSMNSKMNIEMTFPAKLLITNLGLTGENTLKAAEDALEAYFIPKKNIVYERLRLFDGTIVKPVGETTLMIERKGKHWPIKFQVVEVNNSPLISAETCKKLDLIKVNVEPVDYVKAEDLTTLTREFILDNYKDVFEGLGHIGDSSFVLNPDIKPVQHTPRRIPIALQDKVKDKLDDLETKGIIAKVSEPTEWISSMVVVTTPKKIRICLDPLDLNKAIQRPKYQMPTLEEVLPRITNAKVFSTLDAKDGFYQIKLDEQSSRKTTFWTPFGRYRYLRMPFGLNLAPEEFERKLHEHLYDLPGIIVLRDDILVVGNGETQEQAEQNHDQNLKRLLERARKEGLKPDPDKVKAVENMPKPTTKEAKFMWAPQHDAAFNKVKKLVTEHPVLKFYDVKKPVTIQCDASERGLGAALLQDGQPISFASRTLSKTEQQYAQIEKECLAIVFACNKFNQYIAGKEDIIVESDHKPLQIIFKKSILTAPQRLQRMLLRLQRYNLRVTYKPGSQMYLADHLSRASLPLVDEFKNQFEIFAVELEGVNPFQFIKVSSERLAQIQKSTGQDPVLETLKSTTLTGWPETKDQLPLNIREYWNYREEITLHNGILLKNQRVIIPKVMRPEIATDVPMKIEQKRRQTKFFYDKSAKILPQIESSIEYNNIFGQPIIYTDDYGCSNGCSSMYIDTVADQQPGLEGWPMPPERSWSNARHNNSERTMETWVENVAERAAKWNKRRKRMNVMPGKHRTILAMRLTLADPGVAQGVHEAEDFRFYPSGNTIQGNEAKRMEAEKPFRVHPHLMRKHRVCSSEYLREGSSPGYWADVDAN